MMFATDVRIIECQPYFTTEQPRARFKFSNAVAGVITFCHVRVRVENRRGEVADGWGAILLSYPWAFREPAVDDATKDRVMRRMVEAFAKRLREYREYGHPIDIFMTLQPEVDVLAADVCAELNLPVTLPPLAAQNCVAPVDAALHDAFGKVNGISTYDGYGREHMRHDLGSYLGPAYRDRTIADILPLSLRPRVPVFHVVGGLDALTPGDVPVVAEPSALPQSLAAWIAQDGVYFFKIKLNGRDHDWDFDRVKSVYTVARQALARQRREPVLALDLNEGCENPDYAVDLLRRMKAEQPAAFDAVLFVEQPTARDLLAEGFDMRPLAALRPLLLDEGLARLEDLDVGLTFGWTGPVLKTCKSQTVSLLLATKAEAEAIPYALQDLTNPGIALVQSVGLAARLNPLGGVEANARQFYPDASRPESAVHTGLISPQAGTASTRSIRGPGLGYRVEQIPRMIFHPDGGESKSLF